MSTIDDGAKFVGACAQVMTAGTAVWLVVRTVPRELSKWRRTKYEERRHEVAAAGIVAARALANVLTLIISPLAMRGDPPVDKGKSRTDWLFDMMRERLARAEPQFAALQQAQVQAEIYLDADQTKTLQELSDHYRRIESSLLEYKLYYDDDTTRDKANAAFRYVFGGEARAERERLVEQTVTALRPDARFQVPEDKSRE